MADPNREPADGKLPTSSLKCWGYPGLTFLPFCAALSQEEINGFVGRLFYKDPQTTWPADFPLPYSSKNLPPLVRGTVILVILRPAINISCWLVIHDLYLDREVDVELFDEDNNGQEKPASDDAGGEGAPSVETFAPNPIGSSLARESHPSTADQTITTTPSGGGQKKKRVALGTKHKQDKALADQVIIELPPYHGPQSPLVLVDVEHIFGRLFEAF
jgi:hypothetical protein